MIRNFSKTDGDKINIVDITRPNSGIFYQNNKDVTGDDNNDTVIATRDLTTGVYTVYAVLDNFTDMLVNDDFVNDFVFIAPATPAIV